MGDKSTMDALQVELTSEDRSILESHKGIVDGIALFMGSYCEIALHSLEVPDKAVIKIINNQHTNREVGSPLSDHGVQLLLDFQAHRIQQTSCYTTISSKGEPMRSVFTVITNAGRAIGLLGINFNMKVPLSEFISTFSLFNNCAQPVGGESQYSASNSIEELVHNAVSGVVRKISSDVSIPNHEKNKYIVFGLHENGIFDIKGSVILVAEELHLSKFTIYSYIRELKEKTGSGSGKPALKNKKPRK